MFGQAKFRGCLFHTGDQGLQRGFGGHPGSHSKAVRLPLRLPAYAYGAQPGQIDPMGTFHKASHRGCAGENGKIHFLTLKELSLIQDPWRSVHRMIKGQIHED